MRIISANKLRVSKSLVIGALSLFVGCSFNPQVVEEKSVLMPLTPSLQPEKKSSRVPDTAQQYPNLYKTFISQSVESKAQTNLSNLSEKSGKYISYIPVDSKIKQTYKYSCEFDAALVILNKYGIDSAVDDMISKMSHDTSIEPYFIEKGRETFIYGGDIRSSFSGDYKHNFLARSTGDAFVALFSMYGLSAVPIHTVAEIKSSLQTGKLVWMKTTVDFLPGRPATWITPQGERIPTVLGNDHAVVVVGFNEQVAVVRDILGPTVSNPKRLSEYEVPWSTFEVAWGQQNNDALAVSPGQPK